MSSASSPPVITSCHSARILYGSVRWFGQVFPSISLRQHTSGLICYSDAVIAAVALSMQEILLLYKSIHGLPLGDLYKWSWGGFLKVCCADTANADQGFNR